MKSGLARGDYGGFSGIAASGLPKLPLNERLHTAVIRGRYLTDGEAKNEGIQIVNALGYTQQALHANLEPAVQAAKLAQDAAKQARKNGKVEAARELFTKAYFLYQSAENLGHGTGHLANEALESLEDLRASQVKAWSEEVPELSKKVDLVLRDQSLEEAVAQIAKAAGLKINLVPGSLADAAAMTGAKEVRVTYLDLRRATVAEALDWLLLPERLNWWTTEGRIAVGSERRRGTNSAWVYDVSLIALPDGAELEKLGDWQKGADAARKDADDFLKVTLKELGTKESDQSVVWYAPGQLLVIGAPEQHEKAEKLFANLADGKAKIAGGAAELQKQTAKRFADRKVQAERAAKASALLRNASAHQRFGWQLLAAASSGRLDTEALTELQIAWKQPETVQLLNGEGRAAVLRSWWIVSEALAAIGNNESELSALRSWLPGPLSRQFATP